MSRTLVTALALGLSLPAGAVPRGAQPAASSEAPCEAAPRDATLRGSDGEAVRLSNWWGKPVILFYEDRHSLQVNQPLKDALFARGRSAGLLKAASLVAVANLQSFNFFPARGIALSYVRDAEKKSGIPILVDLDGTLAEGEWRLPTKTSSVLLLDRFGTEVFRASGPLSAPERERFFSVLGGLLGRDLSAQGEAP